MTGKVSMDTIEEAMELLAPTPSAPVVVTQKMLDDARAEADEIARVLEFPSSPPCDCKAGRIPCPNPQFSVPCPKCGGSGVKR